MPKFYGHERKVTCEGKYEDEDSVSDSSIEDLPVTGYVEEVAHKNYFNDNKREIDFILVCYDETLDSTRHRGYIMHYVKHLERNGLHFEVETGTVFSNLIFIKVHGPYDILLRYASAFKIPLACRSYERPREKSIRFDFMATDLTKPDPNGPIFYRAKETMSGERPLQITATERIMIVETLLSRAPFGKNEREYGLGKMFEKRAFIAAYPLHAGMWEWSEKGPLNDRQLLANYWARISMWYKQQPLNTIEKYYGPEVAFYFAFCGFYNKMLLLASIVGLVCFCFGLLVSAVLHKNPIWRHLFLMELNHSFFKTYVTGKTVFRFSATKVCTWLAFEQWRRGWFSSALCRHNPGQEICSSKLPLCPVFFKQRTWTFTPLKEHCYFTKLAYMFDNPGTVIFAFFMAFWATIFVELWKRQHAMLMYRWHLKSHDEDVTWRQEFGETTKYRRICPVTGNFEPYTPTWLQVFHYSITAVTCLCMMVIVLMAVMATIIYRIMFAEIIKIINTNLMGMVTGAILSVLFIKMFGKWYGKISLWLTRQENPRTQSEFDDSYIYKIFLLSFVNNYAAVSYLAFVKGRLFTHPGDFPRTMFQSVMQGDLCPPAGCLTALCVQLAFIMVLKSLVGNILTLFFPFIKSLYRRYIQKEAQQPYNIPQWEQDYELKEMGHYFLVGEYSEMIMQYGFVTFFVAAFPLAPLCAFINNMIELRTDANKFVRYCRRPVPVRISGLQAWNGILQAMTFMSLVINAFVIAFSSDFVKRQIYRYHVNASMKGYINSTLSLFRTTDLNAPGIGKQKNLTCYYRGLRFPPNHPQKYQLTSDFWYELCMRFVAAVVLEHVFLMLTGIMGYAIPDMPYSLKKIVKYQRYKRKLKRIRRVDEVAKRSQ